MNEKLIMVVDDDPDLVDAVSLKLLDNKFRVSKAYDGIEAWDKIKTEKPDLIILDVMMPGKHGYELCNEIKQDPRYMDITVVLVTAVAEHIATSNFTVQQGKTTLADDYIPKPIDLDRLMDIVKENLAAGVK